MGATSYLFNDYVKDLVSIPTLTNEDSDYPSENSQDEQIALTARTTDKVNILYQMDMGASVQPQIFFLGNHNLSGGSVKVYSYSDAGFSMNQTLVATFTYRAMDMYVRVSSAPTARQYWEYDFSKNGNATSTDSYYEFGRVMVYSDLVQFTDKNDYIKPRGYGFRNVVNETNYGVRWTHKLAEKRERFELSWAERYTANSIQTELRTLYESVYGNAHPFIFIPDISGVPCYYCYIEDPELLWSEIWGTGASSHVGNFKLRLIEAVRGKV